MTIRALESWMFLWVCVVWSMLAQAQPGQEITLSGAEYFIDQDPVEGRGSPLVAQDGIFDEAEEELEGSVPTVRLSRGPHLLSIRLRDSTGKWGLSRTVVFEVLGPGATPFTQHIAAAEYYLDKVQEGSGIPMQAADGTFDEAVEELVAPELNTAQLHTGEHTIYMRVQDAQGLWGVITWRSFQVIQPAVTASIHMAGAEYYFDQDPGEGHGQRLEAVDGWFDEGIEELSAEHNAASLSPGWHTLYVRSLDSSGQWGTALGQLFMITRPGTDLFAPAIAEAQYRLTLGKTTVADWRPLSPADGAFGGVTEKAVIEVDTKSLPLGGYTAYVRMRDWAGRWGVSKSVSFSVTGNPDFDGNNRIDFDDFFLFADAFNKPATGESTRFDLDGSGSIDFADFFLFADAFGKAGGAVGKLLALAEQYLRLPAHPQLMPAYPNPFNPSTMIQYRLAQPSLVRLIVYDVLGQPVRTLVNQVQPAGIFGVRWGGDSNAGQEVASGMYFCRLTAGSAVQTTKLLLVR